MRTRPSHRAENGAGIATLVGGLDAVRAGGLRLLGRLLGGARLRRLLREPALRVAWGGGISVAVALLLTLIGPLYLLALSPLLLGVPHLLADVRYLVAQPGYHRRLRLALPVGLALLWAGLGGGMPAGLAALALTLLLANGRWLGLRRLLGLGLVVGLAAVGRRGSFYWLELGLAHLHNLIALLLFYLWRRRSGRLHLWPLGLFGLAAAALLGGWLPVAPGALNGFAAGSELDVASQRALLAPQLDEPLATRLLLLFAFAQAVHYSVWLRLIPEEARQRPAPRPFRASLRELTRDLGRPLLFGATLVAVGLGLWALHDLATARSGYFQLALFHGHLELCVLALWWVEGRPLVGGSEEGPKRSAA